MHTYVVPSEILHIAMFIYGKFFIYIKNYVSCLMWHTYVTKSINCWYKGGSEYNVVLLKKI